MGVHVNSAGGLLGGVMANTRPGLFSAMVMKVCCVVVWYGMVWCGVVWCGVVWCGVVWCGVVWCGLVWCGVVWCGIVWYGMVFYMVHPKHCKHHDYAVSCISRRLEAPTAYTSMSSV